MALTVPCILFVDRPVALYFNAHPGLRPLFQAAAVPSLLPLPLAGLFLLYSLARKLRGAGAINRLYLAASVATLAGTAAKDELKWLFGRPWPDSWLHMGLYEFHPLATSNLYGGFPSGHTSYIAAPLCVLWAKMPRYRWLWGGLIGLVMVGLVGADYHFVADVLGGLLTGMICAWGSLVLIPVRDA
ncbi:phosphatase PAP2 family protein [Acidocella sp.]|uniref:phosphatase PAP2 family protein n=1 Tax=Acidocella sp. TaxID=50710 RepID=UPI002D800472|nr:phosphatase PAP2 family protein [Acidocella sp.]